MQPTQPQKTMKSLTTQSHPTRGTSILRSGLELTGRLFGHLYFHEQTRISGQGIYPHSEGKAAPLDGRFHRKSQKRTKQPPVCFLYRLPNELIQAIGNLLPLSSAACFSATSRKLLFILGTQYLSNLRWATNDEQVSFLSLMGEEIPCCNNSEVCSPTHRSSRQAPDRRTALGVRRLQLYGPPREGMCPIIEDYWSSSIDYLLGGHMKGVYYGLGSMRHRITRHEVQLYMQLYRSGLPAKEAFSKLVFNPPRIEFLVEPRAFGEDLLLRVTYALPWPGKRRASSTFPNKHDKAPSLVLDTDAKICPHMNNLADIAAKDCISYAFHETESSFDYKTNVESCSYCATDYQLWYKPHKQKVKVRVWKNLGNGSFPPDEKWRRQLRSAWVYEPNNVKMEYEHGSVCKAFEGLNLLSHHQPVIFSERYRRFALRYVLGVRSVVSCSGVRLESAKSCLVQSTHKQTLNFPEDNFID